VSESSPLRKYCNPKCKGFCEDIKEPESFHNPQAKIVFLVDAPAYETIKDPDDSWSTTEVLNTERYCGYEFFGLLLDNGFKEKQLNDDITILPLTGCILPKSAEPIKEKLHRSCARCNILKIVEDINPHIVVAVGEEALSALPKTISEFLRMGRKNGKYMVNVYRSVAPHRLYYYLPDYEKAVTEYDNKNDVPYNDFMANIKNILLVHNTGITPKPVDYTFIDTPEKLVEVYEIMKAQPILATDIETSGLDPFSKKAKVVSISFSWEEHQGICIPLYHDECPFDEEQLKVVAELVKDILEDDKILKLLHNGKFDCNYLELTMGIKTANFGFDTMLAHYALDEARGTHGLKRLALQHTDLGDYDAFLDTWMQVNGLKNCGYDVIPLDILWQYNCCDTDATLRLYNLFRERLLEEPGDLGVFRDLMDISEAFSQIERNGWTIDLSVLAKLEESMPKEIEVLTQNFFSYPEVIDIQMELQSVENKKKSPKQLEFNPDSPIQMRKLLFDKLQLQEYIPMKKLKDFLTDKGKAERIKMFRTRTKWKTIKDVPLKFLSTGAEVLEFFDELDVHECVKILMSLRKLQKLYGTYVQPVRDTWISDDGYVHASNQIAGTQTGRLACSNPNLQNIPRGSTIKNMFISKFKGGLIGQLDYSQIELRVAALVSREPVLLESYRNGEDIHKRTAAIVNEIDIKEVTKEQRQNVKDVNFGILYGRSAFSLAPKLKKTVDEAEVFIENYFERLPLLKQFIDSKKMEIIDLEVSTSMFGRKRRFTGLNKTWMNFANDKEKRASIEANLREGVNHVIQSTAASFTLYSVIELEKFLKRSGLKSQILGTVYDSIMLDLYPGEQAEVLANAKRIMEEVGVRLGLDWIDIPIVADCEVGPRWGKLAHAVFTEKDREEMMANEEQQKRALDGKRADEGKKIKDSFSSYYDLASSQFLHFNNGQLMEEDLFAA